MTEEDKGSDPTPPPSIEEFVISNYQIFTVIGVLGGLSVYLAQLSEDLPHPRYGIAGSLLMFLIFSSIALKNGMIAAVRARSQDGLISHLLYLGYLGIVIGITGIMIAITILLATHFPVGAGRLLGWIILQFFGLVYLGSIFNINYIANYEGETRFRYIIQYSPHISALFIILWTGHTIYSDKQPEYISALISGDTPEQMGIVFGFAVIHLTYIFTIIVSFIILDKFTFIVEKWLED